MLYGFFFLLWYIIGAPNISTVLISEYEKIFPFLINPLQKFNFKFYSTETPKKKDISIDKLLGRIKINIHKTQNLDPWFVTGISDGDGSLGAYVFERPANKIGGGVLIKA